MKKILVALLVFLGLTLIVIYIFIPADIEFKKVVLIKVNQVNASKFIVDENNWHEWWPKEKRKPDQGETHTSGSQHFYKNYQYIVNWKMLAGDSIIIKNKSVVFKSMLYLFPINKDSFAVQWQGKAAATNNPLSRIENYVRGKKIETSIEELFDSLKPFLENKDNLYGFKIKQEMVKDTALIATRFSSRAYPTTNEIYDAIKNIKTFILNSGAKETNYPMLHVVPENGDFKTMVAIPVDRVIAGNNEFLNKRMVAGKILITEIRGGVYTADAALKTIERYMDDYHLNAPAIPFQSLITDRSKEPDTAKWITRIYYPVM